MDAFSVGCDESIQVTDVTGNQPNIIDYPCLSSSNDCLNSLSIKGGTFQFFSTFHLDSVSEVRECNNYHPWTQ